MKYEIMTIVENSVPTSKGLLGEHGQSMLIEADGEAILFDTGQGGALLNNAKLLEKDLAAVKKVVLSHGHYDHAGGLGALMGVNSSFELSAHPDAFAPKLALVPGAGFRPIGIEVPEDQLREKGVKVHLVREPVEVSPGVFTSGEVPMKNDFETIEPILMAGTPDSPKPDPLADDLSLFIKTEKGLVVLLGCAHRGVCNILSHAADVTGESRVFAVIGGLHLERAPDKQIAATIEKLRELDVKIVAVSHCTGMRAIAPLAAAVGGRMQQNFVSAKFTV